METKALLKQKERIPMVFDELFKPWNEWFDSGNLWPRNMNFPAVNITENPKDFLVSFAVPGMKKEDFDIHVEGNMLTVSSEKEENKEEKDKKFTRKEYNYSSFCRSFTLPEEINVEKIEALYVNGVLNITLPRKDGLKKLAAKQIAVK